MYSAPERPYPESNIAAHRRRNPPPVAVVVAALLLASQLILPFASMASAAVSPAGLVLITGEELLLVTGGCLSDCDGDSDSGGSSGSGDEPSKEGSPYWEYTRRALISRPEVAGDLVWQRSNYTYQPWGPFDVSYTRREKLDWSISGSVPRSVVQAHLGATYERSQTVSETFTVPARTYFKLFVAYPYERWRNYYTKYQDYDDNSRKAIDTATATSYDQWTKTSLVSGPVY